MALILILWTISLASSSQPRSQTHQGAQAEPFYLYTYDQSVQLVNFDASKSATIREQSTQVSKPVAVDYDPSRGYVFVVDGTLRHITLCNGTNTRLVVSGLTKPRGVAFNWMNSTLFWTESKSIRYCRVDFDATVLCHPATLEIGPLDTPHAIAVDPQRGQLYWTESGTTPSISKLVPRGNGYAKKVLLSRKLHRPTSLSVEHSTGHVYWADPHIPALGCIGCQSQHIFVKFSSRYEPYSVSVFDGTVYFYNRKRLNGEFAFYGIPTTKWTHLPENCKVGKCTTAVKPKPELLLGSSDINVIDFMIINATLQDPVTEVPTSPAVTTEGIMFMTERAAIDPIYDPDESSTSQTKTSRSPSQTQPKSVTRSPSLSPTNKSKDTSRGFKVNIHPGILAAAAAILCAVVMTTVLAIVVWRKRRARSSSKNDGFSSLTRQSPPISVCEEPAIMHASTVGDNTYDHVLPSYNSCALNNPTYTGQMPPAVVSDHLGTKIEQASIPFLFTRDATNLANPNYDAVIEIDHISRQDCQSMQTSKPTIHDYDNVEELQPPHYRETAFSNGHCALQMLPALYDLPTDQSSQSTTSKSMASQYSQSGVSNSSTVESGPKFHLAVPPKPQCTQTI